MTSPVGPRTTRDELVLRAHSAWVADPRETAALFRGHERLHQERLLEYEGKREWMEREWGEEVRRVDSPRFGSYAALRRGIIHERGYAEWCRWVADSLEQATGSEDVAEAGCRVWSDHG